MERTSIMLEFCIIGENFNPQVVTDKLSLNPTECYMKGEKNSRNFIRQESSWSISTGYVETLYLSELLDMMLDKLSNKKEKIIDLKREYNLACKFFVVINIKENVKPAIYLDNRIIEFANLIGAEFDFDMYIY